MWRLAENTSMPAAIGALVVALLLPAPGESQTTSSDPLAVCETSVPDAIESCIRRAFTAVAAQPRIGLIAAGGAPVAGAAGPLGLRLGPLPRVTLAARASTITVQPHPPLEEGPPPEDRYLTALGGVAAIGVLPGFTPAPGIGGIGALDVLASGGLVVGGGLEGTALHGGAGVRLGLLRESFAAPGVALSAMAHRVGELARDGGAERIPGDSWRSEVGAVSLRLTAGRQLRGVGISGGAGWDRVTGDITVSVMGEGGPVPDPGQPGEDLVVRDHRSSRWTVFGGASRGFHVFQGAVEVGWQSGGSAPPGIAPRLADELARGRVYGTLSIRAGL